MSFRFGEMIGLLDASNQQGSENRSELLHWHIYGDDKQRLGPLELQSDDWHSVQHLVGLAQRVDLNATGGRACWFRTIHLVSARCPLVDVCGAQWSGRRLSIGIRRE